MLIDLLGFVVLCLLLPRVGIKNPRAPSGTLTSQLCSNAVLALWLDLFHRVFQDLCPLYPVAVLTV
jgi:hypothetical protein